MKQKRNVSFTKTLKWCFFTAVFISFFWICAFIHPAYHYDNLNSDSPKDSADIRFESLIAPCLESGKIAAMSALSVSEEDVKTEVEYLKKIFSLFQQIEVEISQHPELKKDYQTTLDDCLCMYSWHMSYLKEVVMRQKDNQKWLNVYAFIQEDFMQIKTKWMALH